MIIRKIKENTAFSSKNSRHSTVLQLIQETEEGRQLCWVFFCVFLSSCFSFFITEGVEFLTDSNHNDSNLRTIKVQ